MNNKKMIRIISLVVVLSLTFTFSVFAFPQGKDMQFEKKGFNNKAADYMKENGVIKGDGNGNYYWNDYVKRGDMTVMIVRAFKLSTMLGDNFGDVESGSYYYDAILTVKSHGIAKGDGKNFNPKKYVTIGEAKALIERSVAVANKNVVFDEDADLDDLFSGDKLNEYATREDIANMLYYVLVGKEYEDDGDEDEDVDDKYDIDTVKFTAKENTEFKFDAEDVDKLVDEIEKVADDDFDYLQFTLPLKSEGRLYFDYTSATKFDSYVKAATKYYETSDPSILDVSFVPKNDFSGTVSVEYKAYDVDENLYTGIIEIVVEEKDVDLGTIEYEVKENDKLTLDDKIVDAFEEATDDTTEDEEFDYVMFELPSTGKLYYDYTSASNYDYIVKDTDKYYDEAEPKISEVTFVPKTDYTGTASIEFTVYDEEKNSYTGIIEIDVEDDIVALDTIEYDTAKNEEVTFDDDDFIRELKEETSDDNELNYVKFSLPTRTEGKLYYDYSSASSYKSVVTDSAKYFVESSKYLNKVTFVPYTNFDGKVNIDYIAVDVDGVSYKGTIQITVND